MRTLRLVQPANLGVLFDAARLSYSEEAWHRASKGIVTRESFIEVCSRMRFPTLGFEYGGTPIGGMMFDGTASHLAILPEYHGKWAHLWDAACDWMFSLKDPFTVQIEFDNKKCQHFLERNGWKAIAIDESFVTYEISSKNRIPLRKRAAQVVLAGSI